MKRRLIIALLALAAFALQWGALYVLDARAASLTILGGTSIANSMEDGRGRAWALEQDFGGFRAGILNEGHVEGRKRDGVYLQRALSADLTPRLATSAFAGPYLNATTLPTGPGSYRDSLRLGVLAGVGLNWRVAKRCQLVARAERVLSFDNTDADVILIGVRYQLGEEQ
jgi:hypothetical protein